MPVQVSNVSVSDRQVICTRSTEMPERLLGACVLPSVSSSLHGPMRYYVMHQCICLWFFRICLYYWPCESVYPYNLGPISELVIMWEAPGLRWISLSRNASDKHVTLTSASDWESNSSAPTADVERGKYDQLLFERNSAIHLRHTI